MTRITSDSPYRVDRYGVSARKPPDPTATIGNPREVHFWGSRSRLAILIALLCGFLPSCVGGGAATAGERVLRVESTAYNSIRNQTNAEPNITAWGDVLEPGMKSIAISRDLMALGLTHGVTLTIDGLPGEFRVLDKMAKRWTKKIDIYMGEDVQAARDWGVRKVTIRWKPARPST